VEKRLSGVEEKRRQMEERKKTDDRGREMGARVFPASSKLMVCEQAGCGISYEWETGSQDCGSLDPSFGR
jgi:hypothetical protein